jgi:CheY-like chemotaxis protein
LAKFPDLEVLGASTVGEAIQMLAQGPPDLLLSDIDLPDRLGLEMIGELRKRGYSTPIVFISAYLKAFQAQIPPHAGVEVFEKPISIDQLRTIVQERLAAPPQSFSPFGVPEFLQIAALGRHSVLLEVARPSGKGLIIVYGGEAWSASDPHGAGPDAFWRLVGATDASITCSTLIGSQGPRNLTGSIESLLLEAACRQDESTNAGTEPFPEPVSALADPPDPFDALVDEAISLMMGKRYPEAQDVFQKALALHPEDRRVEANLRRLKDLIAH